MIDFFLQNLLQILITILTAIISFIGMTIKNSYTKYINTKTKKEIVYATVQYVEQICKNKGINSKDKFDNAKKKILEWLREKGIKISDTELEIMIESAVSQLNKSSNEIK